MPLALHLSAASAFADAQSKACGGNKASAAAQSVQQSFASAAAQAKATVSASGGSASAAATSISKVWRLVPVLVLLPPLMKGR